MLTNRDRIWRPQAGVLEGFRLMMQSNAEMKRDFKPNLVFFRVFQLFHFVSIQRLPGIVKPPISKYKTTENQTQYSREGLCVLQAEKAARSSWKPFVLVC